MAKSVSREHLGKGTLKLTRELSVFVNCPFDEEYGKVFDAIVFACVCCGFRPRVAFETGTASSPRTNRIAHALMESKYSVHDLSRCRGEGDENLARFNMPLELGMAMLEQLRSPESDTRHDWLAVVPEGHGYKKFVSDLSGFDPPGYGGEPDAMVPVVMAWLATRPDAVQTPKPSEVLAVLPVFQDALTKARAEWGGRLPWTDVLVLAIEIASSADLIHRFPSDSTLQSNEAASTPDPAIASSFQPGDRLPRLMIRLKEPAVVNMPRGYMPRLMSHIQEIATEKAIRMPDGSRKYPVHIRGPENQLRSFCREAIELFAASGMCTENSEGQGEVWFEYIGHAPPAAMRTLAVRYSLQIVQCGPTFLVDGPS